MLLPDCQLSIHTLPVTYDNWLETLQMPLYERPNFQKEGERLEIGQVLAQFSGIPLEEDDYYNQIYDYVHLHGMVLLSADSLDHSKGSVPVRCVKELISEIKRRNLSPSQIVALLEEENLMVSSANKIVQSKIKEAAIKTIDEFSRKEERGLRTDSAFSVLADVVQWSYSHLQDLLRNADPEKNMPKLLWYGSFKKSHQYLIYFAMKIGCDIAAFSPEGSQIFSSVEEKIFTHEYPLKKAAAPFPASKRNRSATTAYRASKEIETVLNYEGLGFYKPWQLKDYATASVTLKTTFDELFMLAQEKAIFRPAFGVKDSKVKIPVVFSKIYGVSKNRREYWKHIHTVIGFENTILIREFPFSTGANNDFRFHYRHALGRDGKIDPGKMIESRYWKYRHLPSGLQIGLAHAIREMCANPKLKPGLHETLEETKTYLFTQAMQIPEIFLKMLQRFDYSQAVPKVVIYNNELNGLMTRPDAALLLLLNQFGIDLVLFNPAARNDIENFIEASAFDGHWLDDIVFEQEFKKPSIIHRVIFHRFFKK